MKSIICINGSPRKKGNTHILLKTFQDAVRAKNPQADISVIEAAKLAAKPCLHCDSCRKNGGICVQNDGVNEELDKIAAADALVFATPVYWWGITAQTKAFLDRFYAKNDELAKKTKKIGVIATGAAEIDDRQYELIKEQFECICEYLNWEFAFFKPVSASEAGEIAENASVIAETAALARFLP